MQKVVTNFHLRNAFFEISLCILALIYSLPSLAYPYGRDQSVFHYVGREWLRGLIPYRDTFDHKPPGIHVIYALASMLSRNQMWGIRLFELAAIFIMGWLIVKALQENNVEGYGSVILLTAGFYYVNFDFWSTAQVELWEALFLLMAFIVAERYQNLYRAAVLSGLLCGIAFLFKFPSVLISIVIFAYLSARLITSCNQIHLKYTIKRTLFLLILFGSAALFPILLFIGYFTYHGALSAMTDILIGFNQCYLAKSPFNLKTVYDHLNLFLINNSGKRLGLFLLAWLIGLVMSWAAVNRRAIMHLLWPMAALIAAISSVILQRKFFLYHWIVITPFVVLCAYRGASVISKYWRAVFPVLAFMVIVTGFLFPPSWGTNYTASYLTCTKRFWQYARGTIDRNKFIEVFNIPFFYNYVPQEKLSTKIKGYVQPNDTLHVEGFEPVFYVLTGLRSPSRFFSEFVLQDPNLKYHRKEWLNEHKHALRKSLPQFFVTFIGNKSRTLIFLLLNDYQMKGREDPFMLFEEKR
jgi:hypothetical protein